MYCKSKHVERLKGPHQPAARKHQPTFKTVTAAKGNAVHTSLGSYVFLQY